MANSASNAAMRPLSAFPAADRRRVRAVLTDIDDTLSTDGRLTAAAYAALEALSGAGLIVVPVTGRPAGWCDHIARFWPVAAVVGENGAFYFRHDRAARRLIRRFVLEDAARADARRRLAALGQRIMAAVPGTALASDQGYRDADLAIDFCEDVAPLGGDAIDRIVALMAAAGVTAKVSSIHVNGYIGDYDKLTTSRLLFAECFALDIDAGRDVVVYAGDSPNDAPMFAHFPNAVGVANVAGWIGRMAALPAYVTPSPGGAGFVELAAALLAVRQDYPEGFLPPATPRS